MILWSLPWHVGASCRCYDDSTTIAWSNHPHKRDNHRSSKKPRWLWPPEGGVSLSNKSLSMHGLSKVADQRKIIYTIHLLLPQTWQRVAIQNQCQLCHLNSPLASLMVHQKAKFFLFGISAEFLGELHPDAHALQWVKEDQHHVTDVLHPRERILWTRYSGDTVESFKACILLFLCMHIW